MRSFVIALVLVSTFAGNVMAQTPTPVQVEQKRQDDLHEARLYQWMGGGFMVAGAVLEVLSNNALAYKTVYCSGNNYGVYGSFATCQTVNDPNWSVLTSGLILTGGGAAMMIVGGVKAKHARAVPSLMVGPRRVAVRWSY